MDTIVIAELEVFYRVGVTEEERAGPQRLLISVELASDLSKAQKSDNLVDTADYAAICRQLLHFGDDRQWNLIESVAGDIAERILEDFSPAAVTVEVKKFVIPQARHVAVRISRSLPAAR